MGVLPIAAAIMLVVLPLARAEPTWVVAAGIVAAVATSSAIFGFTFLDEHFTMVTPVTYANQTGRPVEVLHQSDGDLDLQSDLLAVAGTYVNQIGYRQGPLDQNVAHHSGRLTVFDRTVTRDELRGDGGRISIGRTQD